MFKSQVVSSRNIRKKLVFNVFLYVFSSIILFFILVSLNVFGAESPISQFYKSDAGHIVINISLFFVAAIFFISTIANNRAKKLQILGRIELDENGLKYSEENQLEISYLWNSVDQLTFDFFSVSNRNNPHGCMNYLTLQTGNEAKTFEIVIKNSLAKADFGELLSEINRKVPVKVTYAITYKKILKDKDFKFN